MLFKSKKRCSKMEREKYSANVQRYLKKHALHIVQKIYDDTLGKGKLKLDEVRDMLGEDYPIAPWVDKLDVVGQFAAILEEAGYKLLYDENGGLFFEDKELYSAIAKNHLRFSGSCIVEHLSEECERTGGKLTYFQLQRILGFHYPRAPYVNKDDTRACIIIFIKEMGIPFKFDDTYVYFP